MKSSKLYSNIIYNDEVARSFHNTDYYKSESDRVLKNYLIRKDKYLLNTEDKEVVSDIIEWAKAHAKRSDGEIFKSFKAIYNCNVKYAKAGLPPPIHRNVFFLLTDHRTLMMAYRTLRSKQGSLTKAAPLTESFLNALPEELRKEAIKKSGYPDGITADTFITYSKILRSQDYFWDTSRRIWIPKPGRTGLRPITIPSFMDKVIQETIRMVLEAIYEPWFEKMNCSFGFRPNKGCHDAIVSLTDKRYTQALHTAIEGDIKGAYDRVNQETLIEILSKRISDRKFINLLRTRLKTSVLDTENNKTFISKIGIPQGGSDSPYLFNIYMMEFDRFIKEHLDSKFLNLNKKRLMSHHTGTPLRTAPVNKVYSRQSDVLTSLQGQRKILVKEIHNNRSLKIPTSELNSKLYGLIKEIRDARLRKLNIQSKDPNRVALRYHYIRYADDFIIITNAPKPICEEIKTDIALFLKDKLSAELALDKTNITDMRKQRAHFLGFELASSNSNFAITKVKIYGKFQTKRTAGWSIRVYPDSQRLIDRLFMKHYCTRSGIPREIPWLSTLEPFVIIERYNSVLSGLVNYYAEYVHNKASLSRWIYIIRSSCLRTLAQKYQCSVKGVIKRFGDKQGKVGFSVVSNIQGTELTKTWSLKTHAELTEAAMNLNRRKDISKTLLSIDRGNFPTYPGTLGRTPRITDDDYLDKVKWVNWRTMASFEMPCIVCGSIENVEMHHVKAVRKGLYSLIKSGDTWKKMMSIRNRKQVPVCQNCHMNVIHAGKYSGPSLKDQALSPILYDNRIINIENSINPRKIQEPEPLIDRMKKKGWEELNK